MNNEEFLQEDIDKNKTIAGIAYFIFFIPLLICPDSRFGKFHANQSLVLLLFSIGGGLIISFIPFIGGFVELIFNLFVLILVVSGLLNGLNGVATKLPIIGSINLLK